MNTVTKNRESNLIQFVGRGNNLTSYAVVEVEDKHKELFVYPNIGGFGKTYSLFGDNVEWIDGIKGKAIKINEESKPFAVAISPMYSDFDRTIATWVKASADGRRLILNSNSRWRASGQFFNLSLNAGFVEISLHSEITATATQIKINDNKWHHLAVVVPTKNAVLSDCKIIVDGKIINNFLYQNGDAKINKIQSNWMLIASQSDKNITNLAETMNMFNFVGYLDDFCNWTRALCKEEIA